MADEQAVGQKGAEDLSLKATVPSPTPDGWEKHVFETPKLPVSSLFMLRDIETGDTSGIFSPAEFVTDPDTHVTHAHSADGKPIVLRVLEQWNDGDGPVFEVVTDDGGKAVLEVECIQDNTLEVEEPEQ